MNKRVERLINKIYNEVWKKIMNESSYNDLLRNNKNSIEKKVIAFEKSEVFEKFAKEFSKRLSQHGLANKRGIWRKYFEAAKKVHHIALPSTYTEFEKEMMKRAVNHNFRMIKSIPHEVLKVINYDLTDKLIKEVAEGRLPRGTFKKELESHNSKNAGLIARTETAKLQTAIEENRSISMGSVAYFWQSSNDKRTRLSHRQMNGVIVFWRSDGQKPLRDNMRGNAGEFPNCRCDCDPIFDELDLTKASYKVYDYKTDKIITMTKQQVLQALNKKSL